MPNSDLGILFIETSGCLPMCGHGTIGLVTFGLEQGLITPATPGRLTVEVPAGLLEITYKISASKVASVTIRNVPSYLAHRAIEIDVPALGHLTVDVAYGGNYYAIVEPQKAYRGLDELGAAGILHFSPLIRDAVRRKVHPVHPLDDTIAGVSHVLWADAPKGEGADGRNAVFYGARAIDRSPCGTGTSARMAQLAATGRLKVGDRFVHESFIGSRFIGTVADTVRIGPFEAIVPLVEGTAFMTGLNTIFVDSAEPFAQGFQVV